MLHPPPTIAWEVGKVEQGRSNSELFKKVEIRLNSRRKQAAGCQGTFQARHPAGPADWGFSALISTCGQALYIQW
jgi:hypothetical protein